MRELGIDPENGPAMRALAGLDERYRGYLRGDSPDGSQGQYIHMDALRKEVKKGYLECIPRLGI